MNQDPVQLIVAAFNSPDRAGEVMAELKEGMKEGFIGVIDAAVVVKDGDGKLKVTDAKRRSTRGFVTGGVIGGLVGLLAGPVGWVALGGGAIGALAGKMKGAPLKAEMQDIGSVLTPNSSAIVAVIEHTWVTKLEEAMAAEGAYLVREALKADIAEQLNADGNVLYTAIAGETGAGLARVTESPEGTTVTGLTADEEGVLLIAAEFTDEEPPDELIA
jgi:uncharacterized membrane protein